MVYLFKHTEPPLFANSRKVLFNLQNSNCEQSIYSLLLRAIALKKLFNTITIDKGEILSEIFL